MGAAARSLNDFFDIYPQYAHSFGEWVAILGPFVFGTVYYMLMFVCLFIFGMRREFDYDPRPMRVWYAIAAFNVLVLPLFGPVPVTVGVFLYVMVLFLLENDGIKVAI